MTGGFDLNLLLNSLTDDPDVFWVRWLVLYCPYLYSRWFCPKPSEVLSLQLFFFISCLSSLSLISWYLSWSFFSLYYCLSSWICRPWYLDVMLRDSCIWSVSNTLFLISRFDFLMFISSSFSSCSIERWLYFLNMTWRADSIFWQRLTFFWSCFFCKLNS